MSKQKLLFLLIMIVILFCCGAARADETGQDYGAWCPQCGVYHGPGESCPQTSAPSNTQPDEPFIFEERSSSPTPTTTTTTIPTLTDAQKFEQIAVKYNQEGEELYKSGQYDEAEAKFWAAHYNDTSIPLYKENLEKARKALAEQKKERLAELSKRIEKSHKKLEKLLIYDPSVVDLRYKQGLPVGNPKTGKALPQPIRLSSKASQQADEVIIALLFLIDTRPGGIFKLNPELPWINPLREPARYKAWEEADKKRIQAEINLNKAQAAIEAMNKDQKLSAARERIVKEEGRAIAKGERELFKETVKSYQTLRNEAKLNAPRDKEPLKDFVEFNEKIGSDPVLKQRSKTIAAYYWEISADSKASAGAQSLKKMEAEVVKFFQRHPELKN